MSVRYDIKQVARYVLIKKGQKAVKIGFSTVPVAKHDCDMFEFPRFDDAELAAYAIAREQAAQRDSLGLPKDGKLVFEIKKVTRYVLTRSVITDKGPDVVDLAEFKRRDDADRVMGTLRAAIHPTVSAIDADGKPLGRKFSGIAP